MQKKFEKRTRSSYERAHVQTQTHRHIFTETTTVRKSFACI